MLEPMPQMVRFGLFQVDVRAGEVSKNGLRVRLQEQPFQVLLALLERPGDLVTRQELRSRIWPAQTYMDFDRGLNRAVNKLREALGDDAGNPRFIETVARRGYRLIVSVQGAAPARSAAGPNGRIRLAVLPLRHFASDPGLQDFSDGLTEELIAHLGRLNPQKLGIIARTSAMRYQDGSKSIEQIAQELKADYIMEGSVRRAQGRVRVTLQLIQCADQAHLWAGTYDRELSDIFAIQNEIASQVGESLAGELLHYPGCPPAGDSAQSAVASGATD